MYSQAGTNGHVFAVASVIDVNRIAGGSRIDGMLNGSPGVARAAVTGSIVAAVIDVPGAACSSYRHGSSDAQAERQYDSNYNSYYFYSHIYTPEIVPKSVTGRIVTSGI